MKKYRITSIPSLNKFAKGGDKKSCPTGTYWNGTKCTKLYTLKNDKKYIDGVAAWDMHVTNNEVRNLITPEYNDQIKDRLYSGKWGFDPESGALIRLDKIQPQSVTKLDDKTKASREKEKKQQEALRNKWESEDTYRQSIIDAGFDPATFGKAKGTNVITGEPIYASSKEEADRINQEAINQAAIEGNAAVVNNPVFKAAAYMTPVGMAIGAMEGAARLAPDVYDFAKDPSWSGAGQIGMDVLQTAPFAGAAIKNAYKINPWAFKEDPNKFYRQIGNKGLEDALNTGVIKSADQATYPRPYFVEGKDISMLEQTGSGAHGRPTVMFETSGVNKEGMPFVSPANASGEYTPWIADMAEVPVSEGRLLKQHWLKGYKEVPTELPGSPNTSITNRLKQFFDRPPGPLMLGMPTGSSGNMVKKNMNYYKQLLDSYDGKKMSISDRKFYNSLIETGKKQDGMVTEAQFNELKRLETGNFDFGKRGYNKESLIQVPNTGVVPPPKQAGFINFKGAFQKYPKGPLTEEEIIAYKNSPQYKEWTKQHEELVNKYGDSWTSPNFMEENLQKAIATGDRTQVNPIIHGGRNWNATDYTIAGLAGLAYPGAAAVFGTAFSPPPVKSKVLKTAGITGVPGGLSSKDTIIDITNAPMDFAKVNQTKDGKIIIGGEFIENANNSVRTAKDWLNANDTYSDKKYPSKSIQSFYGVENGKFKVGKASDFDPNTEIVPRRFGAKNISKAVMNDGEMRIIDKNGDPIYQNTPNTGKFILYSPSTKKAQFTYINSGKSGVAKVNDFLKKNKDAQYIHLDNGRYEYYGLNPEGLTKQDFESYYHQDLGREGTPGYNLIIKKEGGATNNYIELDIPKSKIKEYIDQGYIVEELD
jgi:hypothetical protein